MTTMVGTPSLEETLSPRTRGASSNLQTPHSPQPKWTRPMRSHRKTIGSRSPCTAASIPSRYQTFFYNATERKGFNSQATRFSEDPNENPGPGSYTTPPDSLQKVGTIISRRGMGGLASNKERFSGIRRDKIGPGSYTPHSIIDHHDFNKAHVSGNFHSPIAAKTELQRFTPAPNTYHVNRVHTQQNRLVTAEAAFKSKTPREGQILLTAYTPAPDRYTVEAKLLHPSSCSYKSVFNSKSNRADFAKPKRGPGPAYYSPHTYQQSNPVIHFKHKHYHKHYLCFSAPALPLPPVPPPPGPGHYEIMDKMAIGDQTKKSEVSGAVFKSITGRLMNSTLGSKPGPGSYDPVSEIKRSYLFNLQEKWV